MARKRLTSRMRHEGIEDFEALIAESYSEYGCVPGLKYLSERMGVGRPYIHRLLQRMVAEGKLTQPFGNHTAYVYVPKGDVDVDRILTEAKRREG